MNKNKIFFVIGVVIFALLIGYFASSRVMYTKYERFAHSLDLIDEDDSVLVLEIDNNLVGIELFEKIVPKTVNHVKKLVNNNWYVDKGADFIYFVHDNGMFLFGDQFGNGSGGVGFEVPFERNLKYAYKGRGEVGLSRLNTTKKGATSQIHIVFGDDIPDDMSETNTLFGVVRSDLDILSKFKKDDKITHLEIVE